MISAAAEVWVRRREEVMWPWIRTQGGRRCLLCQPLVERVCSLSVPFLVPALACRGYISHFSLALAPPVPSQNRPSFACQAPWANVAATVVNGGELTRWCQQAVLTTGGTPLFCTICGHENHVSNTTTKSSFASPSFPYILMVVGKLQLLWGLLLLGVILTNSFRID